MQAFPVNEFGTTVLTLAFRVEISGLRLFSPKLQCAEDLAGSCAAESFLIAGQIGVEEIEDQFKTSDPGNPHQR